MTRRLCSASVLLAAALLGCGRNPPPAPAQRAEISNDTALRNAMGGAAVEAGPATATVAIETPNGWATLAGTFKIDGAPPARAALKIDKDLAVCAPGGKQVLSEEIVTDPATGGIKDIVIYLTGPHKKFP